MSIFSTSRIAKTGVAVLLILGIVFFGQLFLAHHDRSAYYVGNVSTSTTTSHIKAIDEHLAIDETLKDVNLCGQTFRAEQVFIDGVDAVQRLAELITNGNAEYEHEACANAELYRVRGFLGNENRIGILVAEAEDAHGVKSLGVYRLEMVSSLKNMQSIGDFRIDTNTKDITIILQTFDGAFENLMGKLE